MPDLVGSAVIAPTRGLYLGSTLAPNWLDRITVGDLGYRTKAVLTGYPEEFCWNAPGRADLDATGLDHRRRTDPRAGRQGSARHTRQG